MKKDNNFYRQEFYKKFGSYDNYLNYKKQNPKPPKLPKAGRKFMKVEIINCKNCGEKCEAVGYYQYRSNKHFDLIGYIGWNCNNCGLKEKIKTNLCQTHYQ